MSGGQMSGLQLAPSVEGQWWVIPARPGYGAAAQPIAGKPAPTRTAYGLECVRYLWRAISYETRSSFVPSKTCENSHPGIKSLSRRSIGDATLAGRNRKAHQRPVFIAGAFFVPAMSCYGGGARDTFGCAGLLSSRPANPRTAATLTCLAASGGSSITKGTHA